MKRFENIKDFVAWFKATVDGEVCNWYYGDKYLDISVGYEFSHKTNCVVEGVAFKSSIFNVGPLLYWDYIFEMYNNSDSESGFWNTLEDCVIDALSKVFNIDTSQEALLKPEKCYCTLVNTELNGELLSNVPHREFLNLSIIVRCRVDGFTDTEGIGSYVVSNRMLPQFKVSEDELIDMALANTAKLYPSNITDMHDIMVEILTEMGFPKEEHPPKEEEHPMFVISNSVRTNGAIGMLNTSLLDSLCERFNGSDLILLPSSIHEVIAVPKSFLAEGVDFSSMVCDINHTSVADGEILSNTPYIYKYCNKSYDYYCHEQVAESL